MPDKFNSTTRFSGRVDNYIRYRPGYPDALIHFLLEHKMLVPGQVVADVGSGTGILSGLFLKQGCTVYGIEPNLEMREAGEKLLAAYPSFKSVNARAEETGLEPASVDTIAAGQAFHWFDAEQCRSEFKKILKPGGFCLLIWNDRKVGASGFLKEYDDLLHEHCIDYKEVNHKNIDDKALDFFFGKDKWKQEIFGNRQVFDFEGLKGRVLSSSYAPAPGHPRFIPMLVALRHLYDSYQQYNTVTIQYDTRLYYGRLD